MTPKAYWELLSAQGIEPNTFSLYKMQGTMSLQPCSPNAAAVSTENAAATSTEHVNETAIDVMQVPTTTNLLQTANIVPEDTTNMDYLEKRRPVPSSGDIQEPPPTFLYPSRARVILSRNQAIRIIIRFREHHLFSRITLYYMNLLVHVCNILYMELCFNDISNPEPSIGRFLAFRFRFFTTWVVISHIIYSIYALLIEVRYFILSRFNIKLKKPRKANVFLPKDKYLPANHSQPMDQQADNSLPMVKLADHSQPMDQQANNSQPMDLLGGISLPMVELADHFQTMDPLADNSQPTMDELADKSQSMAMDQKANNSQPMNQRAILSKLMNQRANYFHALNCNYAANYINNQPRIFNHCNKNSVPRSLFSVFVLKKCFSRGSLFAGIVWPCTLLTTVFFWTLYNYDRELIFPQYMDKVIGRGSNHILHTWILVFVIFDVILRPRIRPLVHTNHLITLIGFVVLYLTVFYYTTAVNEFWLYPIFEEAYNSGYFDFIMLHLILLALILFFYFFQWSYNDLFHGHMPMLRKRKIGNYKRKRQRCQ